MEFDIIIAGGGLSACFCALEAAKIGMKTALITGRSYLGDEITSVLRPWIKDGQDIDNFPWIKEIFVPEDEKAEVKNPKSESAEFSASEIPVFCGSVKKKLFEMLEKHGITLLFMSHVAGIAVSEGAFTGTVLGNKYGCQLMRASSFIDCTDNRNAAGLSEREEVAATQTRFIYTMEYLDVSHVEHIHIAIPSDFKICSDKLILHPGKAADGHFYLEFSFSEDNYTDSFSDRQKIKTKAKIKAIRIAKYLKEKEAGFKDAYLYNLSEDIHYKRSVSPGLSIAKGIFKPSYEMTADLSLTDIINIKKDSRTVIKKATKYLHKDNQNESDNVLYIKNAKIPLTECVQSEFEDKTYKSFLTDIKIPFEKYINEFEQTDVLIAGGGTAGINASITAARNGAKTTVIEAQSDFGGTQITGLVSNYYSGNRKGYTHILDEEVESLAREINGTDDRKKWRVAKLLYYTEEIEINHVKAYAGALLCGCSKRGKSIEYVYAATGYGVFAFKSKLFIDSTGDGDLSVFAGEKCYYGNGEMQNTQNYSQWDYEVNCNMPFALLKSHGDNDVINTQKMSDLMRGIAVSHRKGRWYNFASMLTPRDSRRIVGKKTVTLKDVHMKKNFEDTISIALSDYDPHTYCLSETGLMGLMPARNGEVYSEIPFGSCCPAKTENLYICCKALSFDWDAANYIRMTADMQNLGYSIGKIAAAFIKTGDTDYHNYDKIINEIKNDILVQDLLSTRSEEKNFDEKLYLERLADGDESAMLGTILHADKNIVPELEKLYRENADNLLLAKALAWYGSDLGMHCMIDELNRLCGEYEYKSNIDRHPVYSGVCVTGAIGKMDDYWQMNSLIVLLGKFRRKEALGALLNVLDKTIAGGLPKNKSNCYIAGRIEMQRVPNYHRILALAYTIKQNPDPAACHYIEQLLDRDYISGYVSKEDDDSGENYYSAMLELFLAGALAACGSKRGMDILKTYTEDKHYDLSEYAADQIRKNS